MFRIKNKRLLSKVLNIAAKIFVFSDPLRSEARVPPNIR